MVAEIGSSSRIPRSGGNWNCFFSLAVVRRAEFSRIVRKTTPCRFFFSPFRNRSIISSKVERLFHRVAAPPSPPCTHVLSTHTITDGRDITFAPILTRYTPFNFSSWKKRKVWFFDQSPSFSSKFSIMEKFSFERNASREDETALNGMENATNRGDPTKLNEN